MLLVVTTYIQYIMTSIVHLATYSACISEVNKHTQLYLAIKAYTIFTAYSENKLSKQADTALNMYKSINRNKLFQYLFMRFYVAIT
jgi:hypothetical protein